jgi:hypothetical protein
MQIPFVVLLCKLILLRSCANVFYFHPEHDDYFMVKILLVLGPS